MSNQIHSLTLVSARLNRLSKLAEIEGALQQLAKSEDFLRQTLREAAPKSVAQFLDDEGMIEDLFKYGLSSRKIRYDDNSYGFKNAEQVKDAFLALSKAWNGAAKITFSDGEPHRILVSLLIP